VGVYIREAAGGSIKGPLNRGPKYGPSAPIP